jgi:hypothetical protein
LKAVLVVVPSAVAAAVGPLAVAFPLPAVGPLTTAAGLLAYEACDPSIVVAAVDYLAFVVVRESAAAVVVDSSAAPKVGQSAVDPSSAALSAPVESLESAPASHCSE